MSFKCPLCGSAHFGSTNVTRGGPLVRQCHGRINGRTCDYSFPESQDAEHGVEPTVRVFEVARPALRVLEGGLK